MSRPKIALVHMPYSVRGGEDRHLEDLARAYEHLGFPTFRWPEEGNPAAALSIGHFQSWDVTLRRERPDLLHLHNIHPRLGPAFLRWIRRRHVPAIMSVHNHRFYCSNGLALYRGQPCKLCRGNKLSWRPLLLNCNDSWPKSAYYGLALMETQAQGLLHSIRRFVAPTEYMRDELTACGLPAEKIAVIPHPVAAVGPSPGEKTYDVLYAGRLSPEKGVETLLAAADRLPQRRFAFAGAGPLEAAVRAAQGTRKNIFFLEKLARAEVTAAQQSARVIATPSLCEESFSLASVEGLLAGARLAISGSESLRWLTQEPMAAVRAEGSGPDLFAAALERALQLPPPSATALAAMAEKFSFSTYENRLAELVHQALTDSPPQEIK